MPSSPPCSHSTQLFQRNSKPNIVHYETNAFVHICSVETNAIRPSKLHVPVHASALEHVVCSGESRLSQVSNSPQANVFPAGVANFGKAIYR